MNNDLIEQMIEAESEAAHGAMMLALMLLMLTGCGAGAVLAAFVIWLADILGASWPAGW